MKNLVLASKSAARKTMLKNAGLDFQVVPADIDEREIQIKAEKDGKKFDDIAAILAREKSVSISHFHDGYVIGSDQIMVFDNKILSKSKTKEEAKEKLNRIKGKTHDLISSVCVSQSGEVLWSACDKASLTMKDFDHDFLDSYLNSAGDNVLSCVGGYAIESGGSWLFERIEGDFFTILGMPLLPLLSFLETKGFRP